jgi:hypothetical protein
MSEPATLRICSDDHDGTFYAEWAAPQWRIPALARWIQSCKMNAELPAAANYADYTSSDPLDQFTTQLADHDAEHPALSFRYEVHTTAADDGWIGDLTVRRIRPHTDQPNRLATTTHQVSFSDQNTTELHHLAAEEIAKLAQTARDLRRPLLTAAAEAEWRERAAMHLRWAGARLAF